MSETGCKNVKRQKLIEKENEMVNGRKEREATKEDKGGQRPMN